MGYTLQGERLEILRLGNSVSIHTNGRTFCMDLIEIEQLYLGLAMILRGGHDRAQTPDMSEQRPPSFAAEAAALPRGGHQPPTLEDI